jgi:hypothetical protein
MNVQIDQHNQVSYGCILADGRLIFGVRPGNGEIIAQ